jgi:hypothetical protein
MRRGATTGAYTNNTPQGRATEGKAADDALMVDQGCLQQGIFVGKEDQ